MQGTQRAYCLQDRQTWLQQQHSTWCAQLRLVRQLQTQLMLCAYMPKRLPGHTHSNPSFCHTLLHGMLVYSSFYMFCVAIVSAHNADFTRRDPCRLDVGKTSLEVHEDPLAGTHVPNLLYVDVQSSGQVLQLVAAGNCNRATAHTGAQVRMRTACQARRYECWYINSSSSRGSAEQPLGQFCVS